jgi:pimeloyl-ACP methyl ester carboxylesterase
MMNASANLSSLLNDFRAAHRQQEIEAGGHRWRFITGGSSEPAVVLIAGAGGTAESMFTVHAALEPKHHVISIGIPGAVATIAETVAGIEAILDHLGIRRAVIVGHSLGGMVAQLFARTYPERVAGLVLANTGIYLGARAVLLPRAAQLLSCLPAALLRHLVQSQMNRLLRPAAAADFWCEFYQNELQDVDAAARLKMSFALLADALRCLRRQPLRAGEESARTIPVQIIASEDDTGFKRAETELLRTIYPKARQIVLPAPTGHQSFIFRLAEYVGAIEELCTRITQLLPVSQMRSGMR